MSFPHFVIDLGLSECVYGTLIISNRFTESLFQTSQSQMMSSSGKGIGSTCPLIIALYTERSGFEEESSE